MLCPSNVRTLGARSRLRARSIWITLGYVICGGLVLLNCAGDAHSSNTDETTLLVSPSSSGGRSDATSLSPTSQIDLASGVQPEVASPASERVGCDLAAAMDFCGGGTCHYDDAQEFGSSLALWDRDAQMLIDGVEFRLVNVAASYHNVPNAEDCPPTPELLIDPVNVEQSLIIKKLLGTHACGDEMPKFPYPEWGATNNPGDQRVALVQCIRDWVLLLVKDYNEVP